MSQSEKMQKQARRCADQADQEEKAADKEEVEKEKEVSVLLRSRLPKTPWFARMSGASLPPSLQGPGQPGRGGAGPPVLFCSVSSALSQNGSSRCFSYPSGRGQDRTGVRCTGWLSAGGSLSFPMRFRKLRFG